MKTMIAGLAPEYRYPGNLAKWKKRSTLYAANLGASLISNALLRQFDAEYVCDFDDIEFLKNKYDTCVLALSTHLHPTRDVSVIADAVEKLDMKTVIVSVGVNDYETKSPKAFELHPSVMRLLRLVSDRSEWIGVRGRYSADVLLNHGFGNVVPVGCGTVFWGLKKSFRLEKPAEFSKPLVVYHRSLMRSAPSFLRNKVLLGQDFEDEIMFTENLEDDTELMALTKQYYGSSGSMDEAKSLLADSGVFIKLFDDWFQFIGQHDFVVGPRIHGSIAALIQGVPAVVAIRDLRSRELTEFFDIPAVTYDELDSSSLQSLYAAADYSGFNELYGLRYDNYVKFLNENGLVHKLTEGGEG